jgi:hypothetical protein
VGQPVNPLIIAGCQLVAATAGEIIGDRQGHPVWSAIMGLVLPVLGVVLVALSRTTK